MLSLLLQVALSHTFPLVGLTMILNHAVNANYLSLVYPISLLLYAALDSPRPAARYFDLALLYTLLLIIAKFAYQFPVFCGTPPFTLRQTLGVGVRRRRGACACDQSSPDSTSPPRRRRDEPTTGPSPDSTSPRR